MSKFTRSRMADALYIEAESIRVASKHLRCGTIQTRKKPPELLERYKLTDDEPVILTVARLATTEQYKGYDNVLSAMPEILNVFQRALCHCWRRAGPGEAQGVEQELRRSKVTMAGYVPNDSLRDHYNLCDVFAMPSKGEGSGLFSSRPSPVASRS